MMAKASSDGNGTGQTSPPGVHFVLQGKGGIGKSVVASWLAEFLIDRGQLVRCIDGDRVNRSLSQHKAFTVEKLDLVNQDGVLHRTRYDSIIERFATDDAVFVVDNGATVFLPLWTYIVATDVFHRATRSGATRLRYMCRSAEAKC
jgi:hypothetical protein